MKILEKAKELMNKRKGESGVTWVIGALIVLIVIFAVQQIQYPILNGVQNSSALTNTSPFYASQQATTTAQVSNISMETLIGVITIFVIVLKLLMGLVNSRSET